MASKAKKEEESEEEKLDRELNSTFTSGKKSAYEEVVKRLQRRAGELFAARRDELAQEVRTLSDEFKQVWKDT